MSESKKISFAAAVLMNINIIVGCGIYIYPQLMAKQAGGISFLGWILAGLLLLPIALTIALAARLFPGEGGFYNYCKTALGQDAGFIANWAYLLGYMGTVATITSVVRDRLVDPIGLMFVKDYPIVFYIVFILLISLLNTINIGLISKIQSVITMLKLLPLIVMLGAIYFYWNPSFDYQLGNLSDLWGTLPLALFAFLGFESCCNISHYIRGGSTVAFRVILIAFSVSTLLYAVFHLGILHIMGSEALATQGVQAFPLFMGFSAKAAEIVALILLVDMMLSFINTSYGAALNNITNINILAKGGLLFKSKFLAKLNGNGMPGHAALVHGVLIIALVLFAPSTVTLTAITNLGVCVAFFLTLLAVFVQSLHKKHYFPLVVSAIGFVSLGILLYLTWTTKLGTNNWDRTLYAMPLIIGMPVGYLMYRRSKKKALKAMAEVFPAGVDGL
jgi:APA family basic amino acid/polyamine antiporter